MQIIMKSGDEPLAAQYDSWQQIGPVRNGCVAAYRAAGRMKHSPYFVVRGSATAALTFGVGCLAGCLPDRAKYDLEGLAAYLDEPVGPLDQTPFGSLLLVYRTIIDETRGDALSFYAGISFWSNALSRLAAGDLSFGSLAVGGRKVRREAPDRRLSQGKLSHRPRGIRRGYRARGRRVPVQ